MTEIVETEVLIVGGGASGLAASMLLSGQGIATHLVSKYAVTSNLPKAHVVSIKSMEMFRELGLEDAIRAAATPPDKMRYAGIYAGFAGPDVDAGRTIARIGAWGRGGQDLDWQAAGSVANTNLMQSRLEPIMKAKADASAPGSVHFFRNFVDLEEIDDRIVATIEDRASGGTYRVSAEYLLACDGGRVVGPRMGVQMEGELSVATSVSLHFTADLSAYWRDEEALTATILNADMGMPCVLVPMGPNSWGGASTDWLVHLISFKGDHKLFDDESAIATMKNVLGLPDLDCTVHVINRWPLDAVVADKFRVGRVFLLGDAAHRMPPAGGHGLNTAIQDAYNLSWKLAAVLRGKAGDALLDTYETERRPLAQYVVGTAFAGWQHNPNLFKALRFSPQGPAERNWANLRRIWAQDEDGQAARRDLAHALIGLLPNYNSLNVAYGFTYAQGALVCDGTASRGSCDPLAAFVPSTRPGHSVPDTWVETLTGRVAIGDIVGRGRFVLIAGEDGRPWVEAARRIADERAIVLDAWTIGGADGDWLDIRRFWERLREYGPAGAILVRPDRFVAWRAMKMAADPLAELNAAFDRILPR